MPKREIPDQLGFDTVSNFALIYPQFELIPRFNLEQSKMLAKSPEWFSSSYLWHLGQCHHADNIKLNSLRLPGKLKNCREFDHHSFARRDLSRCLLSTSLLSKSILVVMEPSFTSTKIVTSTMKIPTWLLTSSKTEMLFKSCSLPCLF